MTFFIFVAQTCLLLILFFSLYSLHLAAFVLSEESIEEVVEAEGLIIVVVSEGEVDEDAEVDEHNKDVRFKELVAIECTDDGDLSRSIT